MRVAFRVDASSRIGTGHLYRCLTLADHLATVRGAKCEFISRNIDVALQRIVAARGHAVLLLPPATRFDDAISDDDYASWLGVSSEVDAEQTSHVLSRSGGCDWLCVDHYALGADWEKAMAAPGRGLLAIDDLANRRHRTHLLLDQNFVPNLQERYSSLVADGTHLLLGPEFALLRPQFAQARSAAGREEDRPVREVLIFFGGSDLPNLTMLAIEAVTDAATHDVRISVVSGLANPHHPSIVDRAGSDSRVVVIQDVREMAALMARADIGFGAAGTTTWERCCVGLPSIVAVLAPNQRKIADGVSSAGAALLAGEAAEIDVKDLADAYNGLAGDFGGRTRMSAAGMKLVDGLGCERVAEAMA